MPNHTVNFKNVFNSHYSPWAFSTRLSTLLSRDSSHNCSPKRTPLHLIFFPFFPQLTTSLSYRYDWSTSSGGVVVTAVSPGPAQRWQHPWTTLSEWVQGAQDVAQGFKRKGPPRMAPSRPCRSSHRAVHPHTGHKFRSIHRPVKYNTHTSTESYSCCGNHNFKISDSFSLKKPKNLKTKKEKTLKNILKKRRKKPQHVRQVTFSYIFFF